VDSADAALLRDTVDEFLWAANYVTRHAFEDKYVTTSKTTLHDDTYEDVRDETSLHSNHVQAARNKAAEACKSVVEKWKQGKKASMPHFTSPHVVYDHRTATFHDEYVSLATVDERIEPDYVLPTEERDTPHSEYFLSDEYDTTGAELHYSNGNWMLHIHCKREMESDTSEQAATTHGTVLGVDLGVNNLAVASTGRFWTGDEFDHW
jgi:transposase